MKGCAPLIAIVVLVIMIVSCLPLAVGVNDSLHVVLTVPDQEYSAGSTITVELRVYQKGVLTNVPDAPNGSISLIVSTHGNLNNPEDLPITNLGTGVYTGSYVVKQDENHLYFFYEVEIGTDHEEVTHNNDAIYIHVTSFQNTVDVNFYGQDTITAHPGDMVTATIEVRYGTTLLDVNSFNTLVARDPDDNEVNLTYTQVSTGIYRATYQIPENVQQSGVYEIYAYPSTGGHDTAQIQVNVLDVWYHFVSIVGETASFEIGVADMAGIPVPDAEIALLRHNNLVVQGTTNDTGLALLVITNVGNTQEFHGWVVSGLKNQTVEGSVFNEQAPIPAHSGFDLIFNGDETIYEPSETVTRQYTAYYNAAPLGTREIYYYVTAGGTNYGLVDVGLEHIEGPFSTVAAGMVITDAAGKFSISFNAPATQCRLSFNFEAAFDNPSGPEYDRDDNKIYEEWPEHDGEDGSFAYVLQGNMYDDPGVKIKSEKFKQGEPAVVTVQMPADYDDNIIAAWGVGELDLKMEDAMEELTWHCWTPMGMFIPLTQNVDGDYEGNFTVPEFIDTDAVTVVAGYNDGATGFPHYDSEVVQPAGGMSLVLILVIIIVLIVVMSLVLRFFKSP